MHRRKQRLSRLIQSRLPTGQFARGVTLLAGGNALGQVLMLAAAPILTRLYTPADFGLLALYMAITGMLQLILSMRYELAISLSETMREAMALLKLCLIIVFLFAVLSLVVVLFLGDSLAAWMGAPTLADYMWMIPISLLLIGSFNAFNYWCVREGSFALIGKARLKQVMASLAVQIGGASFGPVALLGGQVANQAVGMGSLGSIPLRMSEFKNASMADMRKMLVRFRRFPLFATWAALFNSFSVQLPTFFFVALFGPAAAGFYALSNRVLKAPSNVFSSAINDVFLKSAATAHREGNLRQLTLDTFYNLALMAAPLLMLLAIISPELFGFVFGEQWSKAGEYARWMSMLVFFSFISSPLTRLFAIYEKQTSELVFQTVLMVCRALALIAAAQIGDSVIAVMLFSISSSVCLVGLLVWVGRQIGNGVAPMARLGFRAFLVALVICTPTMLAYVTQLSLAFKLSAILLSVVLCCVHLFYLAKKVK